MAEYMAVSDATKNGRFAVPAQEKLSQTEQYLAYVTGLGIALAMIGFIFKALGTVDSDVSTSLLLIGLAVIIVGIGAWLTLLRPWEKFDDLKTPYYTGHEEPAPAGEKAEAAVAEALTAAPAVAEKLAARAETDDLTLIEGIGPRSAAALKEAGIATFAQLADQTPAELAQILKERKVRLVGPTDTWPQQARIAATGDLTALENLRDRIKRDVAEDDLTLIEGIGPKSAAALNEAGITTFAQIATMTPEALEKAIKDRKVRLVGSAATWPQQAALAAAGDLSALEALQASLKGGRPQTGGKA
jgi:predicted flap endonuclease-1-like 5' DNA nuclease